MVSNQKMCLSVIISVRLVGGIFSYAGFHQGLTLSSFLLNLITDVVARELEVCLQMILSSLMRPGEGLSKKLVIWRDALETKGFKIYGTRT